MSISQKLTYVAFINITLCRLLFYITFIYLCFLTLIILNKNNSVLYKEDLNNFFNIKNLAHKLMHFSYLTVITSIKICY